MKNVYIGKENGNGQELDICMVIDSDIATGDAKVFNRRTQKIEIVKYSDKRTLYENIKKLAQDTESEHEEAFKKALATA